MKVLGGFVVELIDDRAAYAARTAYIFGAGGRPVASRNQSNRLSDNRGDPVTLFLRAFRKAPLSVAMTDKEDEEDVRALAAKVASDLSEYGMTLATMLLRLDQASRKLDDARKAAGKLHEEEH